VHRNAPYTSVFFLYHVQIDALMPILNILHYFLLDYHFTEKEIIKLKKMAAKYALNSLALSWMLLDYIQSKDKVYILIIFGSFWNLKVCFLLQLVLTFLALMNWNMLFYFRYSNRRYNRSKRYADDQLSAHQFRIWSLHIWSRLLW
jgi:hypothetical protein